MSHHQNTNTNLQWLSRCRAVLIEMETKNIRQRASSWRKIVNLETSKINSMINISSQMYNISEYDYSVTSPLKYLNFLSEWNGIKTRNQSNQPQSYEEFESKSKNWLNGRRAPNYGNTLFPDMIKSSEEYSKYLSNLLFGNIPIMNNDSLFQQYQLTLLFAYLTKLCTERIAVHQSWKKTNLLCENSVKNMHSQTAKLLQSYAIHDYIGNDLNSFPGSLQKAATFFSDVKDKYLSRLIQSYNQYKNNNNNNNNQRAPGQHTYDQNNINLNDNDNYGNNMNNISNNNMNMNNMNNIRNIHNIHNNIHATGVAIKTSEFRQIMQRLDELERKHNNQASQISTLRTKCQQLQSALQQQPNVSNVSAMIPPIHQPRVNNINPYDKISSNDNEFYGIHHQQQSHQPQQHTQLSYHSNNINHQHLNIPPSIQYNNNNNNQPQTQTQTQTQIPMPNMMNMPIISSIPDNNNNNNNNSGSSSMDKSVFSVDTKLNLSFNPCPPPNNNNNNNNDNNGPFSSPNIYSHSSNSTASTVTNSINNSNNNNTTPRSNDLSNTGSGSGSGGGFSNYEYGNLYTYSSNPNNTQNEYTNNHNNNNNDNNNNNNNNASMHYMTTSQPNMNGVLLNTTNSVSSIDTMLIDRDNDSMFNAFSIVDYN